MIKERMTWRTCSTHRHLVWPHLCNIWWHWTRTLTLSVRPLVVWNGEEGMCKLLMISSVAHEGLQAVSDLNGTAMSILTASSTRWATCTTRYTTLTKKPDRYACIYIFLHASRSKLNLLIKKIWHLLQSSTAITRRDNPLENVFKRKETNQQNTTVSVEKWRMVIEELTKKFGAYCRIQSQLHAMMCWSTVKWI